MRGVVQGASTQSASVFRCDDEGSVTGAAIRCRIKGKRLSVEEKTQNLLVAGDIVHLRETSPGEGLIERREARRHSLFRFNKKRNMRQCLSSHLDAIVLLSSETEPPCSFSFIQDGIAAAMLEDISVLLVVHKSDLSISVRFREKMEYLKGLASTLLYTTCREPHSLEALREAIQGRRVALVGRSGVGKSSILNMLVPEATQRTQAVNARHRWGRSTTTQALLHPFGSRGWIVDTPGVLTLDMRDRREALLKNCFDDFVQYPCRYRNCRHKHEDGCGVRKGLESGSLPAFRYRYYLGYRDRVR